MKEHPIIFNTKNVKAILDGAKTQTRRVIKFQPEPNHIEEFKETWRGLCSYGQASSMLWVRETFRPISHQDIYLFADDDCWRIHGITQPQRDWLWKHYDKNMPSIHMPRWASRITLEITEVRVERVQEITYKDCYAEGIDKNSPNKRQIGIGSPVFVMVTPRTYFKELWDSLNAKRGYGWEVNPWVWVMSFKVYKEEVTPIRNKTG